MDVSSASAWWADFEQRYTDPGDPTGFITGVVLALAWVILVNVVLALVENTTKRFESVTFAWRHRGGHWRIIASNWYSGSWLVIIVPILTLILALVSSGLFVYETQWINTEYSADLPAPWDTGLDVCCHTGALPTNATDCEDPIILANDTIISNQTCTELQICQTSSGGGYNDCKGIFYEPWLIWVEFAFSVVFLIEYTLQLVLHPTRMSYVFSPQNIGEMLCIPPGIIGPIIGYYYYGFQFLAAIRVYSTMSRLNQLNIKWCCSRRMTNIILDTLSIVFAIAAILFSTAGFVWVYENNVFTIGDISSLYESIYFVIITLTTVGYGDLSPNTILGKSATILGLMLIIFIFLPFTIEKIASRVGDLQGQLSMYHGNGHHILWAPDGMVDTFLEEYFHNSWPDHVVLVSSEKEYLSESVLLSDPTIRPRTWHTAGDLSSTTTMNQVRLARADTLSIMMAQLPTNKSSQSDATAVLTASKFRKRNDTAKLFLQLHYREHALLLRGAASISVLGVQNIKSALFALSCHAPGIISLINNLVRSPNEEMKAAGKMDKTSWKYKYYTGARNSLFIDYPLDPMFVGASFNDYANHLFKKTGIMLIGVRSEHEPETDSPRGKFKKDTLMVSSGGAGAEDIHRNPTVYNPGHSYILKDGDILVVLLPRNEISKKSLLEPTSSSAVSVSRTWRDQPHAARLTSSSKSLLTQRTHSALLPTSKALAAATGDSPRLVVSDPALKKKAKKRKKHVPTEWSAEELQVFKSGTYRFSDHIIVADHGNDDSKLLFLRSLRRMTDPNFKDGSTTLFSFQKPVLFLQEEAPSKIRWLEISTLYANVHFLMGSPIDIIDMRRASASSAAFVILSGFSESTPTKYEADADAIPLMIYRLLERSKALKFVDLNHRLNVNFLTPGANVHFSKKIASGSVFPRDFFDSIAARAYFQPQIYDVMSTLVEDARIQYLSVLEMDIKAVSLGQVNYQMLTELLLNFDLVPLGLHRKYEHTPSAKDHSTLDNSPMSSSDLDGRYTFTNPPPTEDILESDNIFVIASNSKTESVGEQTLRDEAMKAAAEARKAKKAKSVKRAKSKKEAEKKEKKPKKESKDDEKKKKK